MRHVGTLVMLVALAAPATAGELVFANGSRLEGDLANETIVVSTGSDLVELAPEMIGSLSPAEIRLKDGRVLRGTLVGGRLKARTALGELAVKADELQLFRADGFTPSAPPPAAPPPPVAAAATPASVESGLPPVSLYQQMPPPSQPATPVAAPPAVVASTSESAVLARLVTGPRLEVVIEESLLYRDALANATPIGRVSRGQQVTYVDSIDRRLQIFNLVIFDGGHWIKVRVPDGAEGWVPAATVREVP
jgi:hypothetical protein